MIRRAIALDTEPTKKGARSDIRPEALRVQILQGSRLFP